MAYLISVSAGTAADVFPAKRSGDKTAPCTICWSKKGDPCGDYSGTYTIQGSIIVRTLAPVDAGVTGEQPRLDSETRVGKTFDALHMDIDTASDKLAADITAAARALAVSDPSNHADLADYTVQSVMTKGVEAGFEENTEAWNDQLNFEMICCPSNVS
jgi:hypothetical protein